MDLKELQEEILRLTDLNASLTNEIENLKATYEDKEKEYNTFKEDSEKRILELQEHNQKLFLRVTQSTQTELEEKEEELTIGSFLETVEL